MRALSHWPDSTLRRALDLVVVLAGILAAAPIMLLIACAIRIESPGPILFTQLRLGRDGRPFKLRKFRKFRDEPQSFSCAVTLKNDIRMTRVGRMLERSKFDELPQLWNVLVGEMAIVGPRPETLDFADCFTGSIQKVLNYTPGLFGPNQAIFRDEGALYPLGVDPHDFYRSVLLPMKARIDIAYSARRTVWSDIGWIAKSVLAVLGLVHVGTEQFLSEEPVSTIFAEHA